MINSLRLPLALGLATALMLTALFGALGATSATFTDRVAAASSVEASRIPAPAQVAAELTRDGVTISWQSSARDFAADYELFRGVGSCTDWTPSGSPVATVKSTGAGKTHAYLDSAKLEAGRTYCYAVRGTFAGWQSHFGEITSNAQVTIPTSDPTPVKRLLGGGSDGVNFYPGSTTQQYAWGLTSGVNSNRGWVVSLNFTHRHPAGNQTMVVDVTAWYSMGSSCTGTTAESQIIASVTGQSIPNTGRYQFALKPNDSFQASSTATTLCLSVRGYDFGHGNPNSLFKLGYGADTWLEGPVAP